MSYRVLRAADAFWRPSNQMGVANTDLGAQLEGAPFGARLWRLAPGQASTRHRHAEQTELYVLLEGTGRVRVDGEPLTLEPLSALLVEPRTVRQVFNDTAADALWLVVGTPREAANTLEMTPERLADLYPDGPRALPPELEVDHRALLAVAVEEARAGMEEGGVPIGGALFDAAGALLGRGHNQRVQRGDPSAHGETEAFRNAGRRRSYRDTILATTLAPCWYCSGLIRQFGIGTVVVGESRSFDGGVQWLRESGVKVVDLDSQECVDLLQGFIARHPDVWDEDIGV